MPGCRRSRPRGSRSSSSSRTSRRRWRRPTRSTACRRAASHSRAPHARRPARRWPPPISGSSDGVDQHHPAGRADRRPLRHVRGRALAHLRRHAARQHRARRFHRACRLSGIGGDRDARHRPTRLPRHRGAADGRDRLCAAARPAQPYARRRPVAAAARDLRAVGHHPERTARALHRRQPPPAGRCDRGRELAACARALDRRAPVSPVRRRRRGDRRAAGAVLSHCARARVPRHLRRSGGRPAHGPRQRPRLCARDGAVARRRRNRRRAARRAGEFRSRDRARPADLRLRGRHHRRARQSVGHARGRDRARRRSGDRRQARSGLAAACRPPRVPDRARRTARRAVSEDPRMSAVSVRFTDRRSAISLAALAAVVVALAFAPLWAGRDGLRLLGEIFAYAALASLWNLLAGYAGLVSVGQQAFVGLGGYMLFALAILAGISPLWAIPGAGLIGALAAVPVAALVFRLRGHYFAIGTWVVAEVFRLLAAQLSALGGGSGTSLPAGIVTAIAATRETREFLVYWTALGLAVLVLTLIIALLRSRYGLALTAIRDNEIAALSNGVGVRRVKFIVYVTTAFCTAMVGAVIFLQKLRISPDAAFSINDWTAFVIFIAVIGGIGRIEGPIVGTAIFFLLRQLFADLGSLYLLMLGAVAIAIMLKTPRGVWGLLADRFMLQIFPLQRRIIQDSRITQERSHDIRQEASETTS